MHKHERLQFLFRKYLANSCSKEELKELLTLSQEGDVEQHLTEELRQFWKSLDAGKLQNEVNWASNYKSIIEMGRATEDFDQPKRARVIKLQSWKVAIAIMLIVGTASFFLWQPGPQLNSTDVASGAASGKAKDTSSHRQLINLPDGSTVVLNANSKLEYPASFNNSIREVYLNGEAFFDITHDPSKPFIVHTGSVSTKVLGTAFNINAHRSQNFIQVTVTRGKVEVKAKEKLLGVLEKNEQVVFHTATEKFTKQTVDPEPIIVWRRNELYFDDVSFAEAALVLSNRFHVAIEFANENLRACQFTAAFNDSTSLEHALQVICELNNASYFKEKNKIIIDGEGCE